MPQKKQAKFPKVPRYRFMLLLLQPKLSMQLILQLTLPLPLMIPTVPLKFGFKFLKTFI